MITIKKVLKLILFSVLPLIMYEIGAVGFYCVMLGTVSWNHVHKIAWSQDLAILLPLLCGAIFLYYLWKLFMYEEPSRINIPRYERPKHEKYSEPNSSGF